eukprot:TRINITY_DN11795_c1_g3_i10.p2 TRINITY_DN11795_c1_g3~~TRINITY_DN11795_c1_g3_i10.p2  ORF type:complete len:333 (+),score=62.44 TRINITY_DN11795_c1_g3_i10:3358-4356(+)
MFSAQSQSMQIPVPTGMVGQIIGKGGATIKGLQSQYGVKIQVPDQSQQTGPQVAVSIEGNDVQGAAQAISALLAKSQAGPGGFGSRTGDNGKVKRAIGFLFRLGPNNELQLLLQHRTGRWSIPQGTLTTPGDLNNNSRDGMMRVLGASCGGGAPPPLDQAHFMDPVVLSTKYLHTILMNPEWGDWYPVPAVAGEVETNINQLSINGEAVQVSNGSAWVDVGLLQAGRDTLEDKDLSMWLTKQSTALLPQILAAFGSGSIRPRVKDNWTSQALAPQVLGNLKFIMQQMTAVDDSVFAQIAGPCFDPDALLDMFRRWENMDGSPALPSPSNTLV